MNHLRKYLKLFFVLHLLMGSIVASEDDHLVVFEEGQEFNEEAQESILEQYRIDLAEEKGLFYCRSEQLLQELEEQLEWLSYYEQSFLKKNENEFKNTGKWEEIVQFQIKKESILYRSRKEFISFLDHFVADLTSISADAEYPRALIQGAKNRMTEAYIIQVQKCIFPKGWQEMYEDYLKKKLKTNEDGL